MKKVFFLSILVMASSQQATAQSKVSAAETRIGAILEYILENLDEETDAMLIMDDLEAFADRPLNINTATAVELGKLHLLDNLQIIKLLEYRDLYGPVYSIYELNAVDGLHPDVLLKIEPFVWFGPQEEAKPGFAQIMKYGRHEFLIRGMATVQKPRGYMPRDDGTVPYDGSRERLYTRYRFISSEFISAGVTAEKDPGEAFLSNSNPNGFDFYSGHLSFKINKFIKNITLGDYVVRSGQGLVIWQGFSMGKSLYSQNIAKTNQGIRPYTSAGENLFFRGASATLTAGNAGFSLFYSSKNMDGNRVCSDTAGCYFTSIQTSGYHRTKGEIDDKNSIGDLNAGCIFSWRTGNLKLGSTILCRQFSMPYRPANQLYNLFVFRGKENFTAGADYIYGHGRYRFWGEVAVSRSGGSAFLQGASVFLHDQIQISALYRYYDKKYHAFWAAPFSEGTTAANENGLYMGAKILPARKVSISAYADRYKSDWIRYTTAAPSNGYDVFMQADFNISRKLQFYLRYKHEEKDKKFRMDHKYENLPEQFIKSRLHVHYQPSEVFTFKTRLEHVFYHGLKTEHGFLLFQDVQLAPVRFPVHLSARLAWFHTESYNSRIYAYENDLLYSFSIPALSGEGIRTYLYLKYSINEKIEVWLKISESHYFNSNSVGSGYNEIPGNHKTEVKFQLRVKI
jgi:DNA uptake protein ComE-like DNA-binding protein